MPVPVDTTVFVHAFKDHVILRGVVTGHERLEGFDEDHTQVRLDSGKDIVVHSLRDDDTQSRLAEIYRKQNIPARSYRPREHGTR